MLIKFSTGIVIKILNLYDLYRYRDDVFEAIRVSNISMCTEEVKEHFTDMRFFAHLTIRKVSVTGQYQNEQDVPGDSGFYRGEFTKDTLFISYLPTGDNSVFIDVAEILEL